jgi:hypothetical protein
MSSSSSSSSASSASSSKRTTTLDIQSTTIAIDRHYLRAVDTWHCPAITITVHHAEYDGPVVSIPSGFLAAGGQGVDSWSYVYDVIRMAVAVGGGGRGSRRGVVVGPGGEEYTRETVGAPLVGDYEYRTMGGVLFWPGWAVAGKG